MAFAEEIEVNISDFIVRSFNAYKVRNNPFMLFQRIKLIVV
jgi:hypothetical protein